MNKRKGLGRGLEALLGTQAAARAGTQAAEGASVRELPLDALTSGTYQPRSDFAEESLAELADSIREQGVLQPLIVRPIVRPGSQAGGPGYEIVAGERRWRAARLAGLDQVPVLVRELDDQSALAVALIENLQREDLNPLEQARSLARLASEFELTHEQVATAVGRARASVSNLLRLLELDDDVKALLAEDKLQMGHARALLPLDAKSQRALARSAVRGGLSVRDVEKRVRRKLEGGAGQAAAKTATDLQTEWLQTQLRAELGNRISLRPARDDGYQLNFAFDDLAQLEASLGRLLELLGQVRDAAGPRAKDSGG